METVSAVMVAVGGTVDITVPFIIIIIIIIGSKTL
jgi:hypothetical protein